MYFNVIYLLLIFVNIVQTLRHYSPCPDIRINHGRVKYRRGGRFVKIFCDSGYMLAGDRYNTCVQGRWEVETPKCVRNTCRPAKTPNNGLIYPSHNGAVLNFFCKPDYILRGPSTIYCDGTRWDNNLPTCQKSNTTVELSCDFERDNDLCGWTHDLNHDFDWIRLNYHTPSHLIGTGPSYDHTKGPNSDGYYLYIEATSRNTMDMARLISPIFNKTNQSICFEFYYHMYGMNMGTLNIYLKKFNDTWLDLKKVWTKTGNQGDQWYRGFIKLGVIDDDYQIVIEGVRGPGFVSDIAIDDLRIITNCSDKDQEFTTQLPDSSVDPFIVQSCENRCSSRETTTILTTTTIEQHQNNSILLCDCDDSCFERNRCCPDYFDICLLTIGVTSDDDEISFTTGTPKTSRTTTTTLASQPLTTGFRTTPSTTRFRTTPTTTRFQTTWTTTRFRTTPSTTRFRTTPSTIRFQTTPSTRLTRPSTVTTTLATTTTTIKDRITYIQPGNEKKDLNNDIIDIIPTIINNDNDSDKVITLTLSPPPRITHERIIITNNRNNNNQQQQNHHRTIIFAVGVIIGTLCTMLIVIFVIKKYESFNCMKRFGNGLIIRQSRSTGDSQSDVRFLTDDEILDLNLPGDYDTL